MTLKSHIRTASDVTILSVEGNVSLGEASAALRDVFRAVIHTGAQHILLDLRGVQYMDSAGLGELIGVYATASSRGVVIKLLNLQPRVRDLMHVTHLMSVFEIFDDEAVAVRSFEDGAATAKA